MFFFFFKQKTAYEMRISDWSSDVCSSDLVQRRTDLVRLRQALGLRLGVDFLADDVVAQVNAFITDVYRGARDELAYFVLALAAEGAVQNATTMGRRRTTPRVIGHLTSRSDEHTSELQSLMSISYAVFCLKKQNIAQQINQQNN